MLLAPAGAASRSADPLPVALTVDGRAVTVIREGASLLEVLRDELGVRSPKDGCSPQGQCGCCTVLVDGQARVACVTAVRRVAGREITTADGLPPDVSGPLVAAFAAEGASQCGFCTPGILCRLAALGPDPAPGAVERALMAHLCRCTGWRGILDAAGSWRTGAVPALSLPSPAAKRRAALEGRTPQQVGAQAVLGRGGFAEDTAPPGALVAVPDGAGGWVVGETLAEARAAAGGHPGRRSGQPITWPLEVPPGDWDLTLQTTWVEPAYLEPDASWCEPGGEPASPVANGGAFGGKLASPVAAAARRLADEHGRAVRVVLAREDVVRLGPKRPPVAIGVRADGTGVARVVRTAGIADALRSGAPGLEVEEIDVPGPPTAAALRAAGWAEAAVVVAGLRTLAGAGSDRVAVRSPEGARAEAEVTVDDAGRPTHVSVRVICGEVLDEVVLRSYVTGAAHMALGWVCSEALAVDGSGRPEDLTIRSWGILRAADTPPVDVELEVSDAEAVNGSDAAFAAVAAAVWSAQGLPPRWPTRSTSR
jgi:aerobic-type carbon monoxide dehydrogenase small subunit (CoxS/CutS family)